MSVLRYWWRVLRTEAWWAAVSLGYTVRPYDQLADARRWRWRRGRPCGSAWWASLTDDQRVELAQALRDQIDRTRR